MENKYTTISNLRNHLNSKITIAGWVRHLRSSGKVLFIVLRDGTGLCQVVMEKISGKEDLFDQIRHLGQESAIEVSGTVREEPRSPGGYELSAADARVIHASVDYPITRKSHGADFLFRHRHLWLRSQRQTAIMKIRDTLIFAIREYFRKNAFVLTDTPIFSPSAGEGASTLFEVDHFGQKVYLAQTGQLYLEAAAMAMRKTYCFGPTFRAEKSKTRRHLTEFWMVEPEIAFINLDELLEIAEEFIVYIVRSVLENHREELNILERDISKLEKIQEPFVRLSYSQVVELLHSEAAENLLRSEENELSREVAETESKLKELEEGQTRASKAWQKEKISAQISEYRDRLSEIRDRIGNIPEHIDLAKNFRWGKDLGGSDETIISKLYDKPVFVTHYPREAKAFYMRAERTDERVVENFDLLAPEGIGEIIGGSVREEDYERLLNRMNEEKMPLEPYQWYLDLRRFGSVPHGGFGLGIERTLGWICGLKHVREAIAFPRMMGKVQM